MATIPLMSDHIFLMPENTLPLMAENTLPLMAENTLPLMAEYLLSLKFFSLARSITRPLTTENTVLTILLIVNTFVRLVYLLSARRHGRNRIRALESIDRLVARQKPGRIRLVPVRRKPGRRRPPTLLIDPCPRISPRSPKMCVVVPAREGGIAKAPAQNHLDS